MLAHGPSHPNTPFLGLPSVEAQYHLYVSSTSGKFLTPHSYRCRSVTARTYGRTVQNNTPSGGARLPPDTKHPESWLHRTVPSSTPRGRTQTIHVFNPGSNNENEFTSLNPFHTTIVLENTLLQYQVQSTEFKHQNWNNHLAIRYKDSSVPTRRILHTTVIPQGAP